MNAPELDEPSILQPPRKGTDAWAEEELNEFFTIERIKRHRFLSPRIKFVCMKIVTSGTFFST
jgi:hypothetical protein